MEAIAYRRPHASPLAVLSRQPTHIKAVINTTAIAPMFAPVRAAII